jgi:hypothetical protein
VPPNQIDLSKAVSLGDFHHVPGKFKSVLLFAMHLIVRFFIRGACRQFLHDGQYRRRRPICLLQRTGRGRSTRFG